MPLALSPAFVIFLIFAVALGYATNNWVNGLVLMMLYIVITLIWRFLVREK